MTDRSLEQIEDDLPNREPQRGGDPHRRCWILLAQLSRCCSGGVGAAWAPWRWWPTGCLRTGENAADPSGLNVILLPGIPEQLQASPQSRKTGLAEAWPNTLL